MSTDLEHLLPPEVRKHPIYWFEDGTLTIEVESQHFLVHRTLLSRHSSLLSKSDTRHISLQPNYKAEDLEALLQCLYHDKPLRNDSPFPHVASILRITSPLLLDLPYFHAAACEIIEGMFSSTPAAFTYDYPLSDALILATTFNLRSVRKAIFYRLVTTTDFEVPDNDVENTTPHPADPSLSNNLEKSMCSLINHREVLPPDITRICTRLLSLIIEHFTPILFTPAATPHMECTNVFAETWGPIVILPAIKDNEVYKPVETLARLKEIDWGDLGLCASCVEEKRKEWTDEQTNVWNSMDSWLSESEI